MTMSEQEELIKFLFHQLEDLQKLALETMQDLVTEQCPIVRSDKFVKYKELHDEITHFQRAVNSALTSNLTRFSNTI